MVLPPNDRIKENNTSQPGIYREDYGNYIMPKEGASISVNGKTLYALTTANLLRTKHGYLTIETIEHLAGYRLVRLALTQKLDYKYIVETKLPILVNMPACNWEASVTGLGPQQQWDKIELD
jgi:hypothetical protein